LKRFEGLFVARQKAGGLRIISIKERGLAIMKTQAQAQDENTRDRADVRINDAHTAAAAAQGAIGAGGMKERTKRLTTIAMLSAVAYIATFLSHMIPITVMGFLRYDPADVVIVIGGFLFGPLTALFMSVVVALIEALTISSTGPIGLIMNVISTFSFACVAAFVYKKEQTMIGAVMALASGIIAMTAVMLLWNYIITPLYMVNVSRADIMVMLVPIFLPFNLLKGALNAAITLLLYKPLVNTLRRAHLVSATRGARTENLSDASSRDERRARSRGLMILAAIILITCTMTLLAWSNII
jgi:riboflavin transporter FmnP